MMILFAEYDLEKLDHRQNSESRKGEIRDHAILYQQTKKKFASAIKLRLADRYVAMEPGIQETQICVQLSL